MNKRRRRLSSGSPPTPGARKMPPRLVTEIPQAVDQQVNWDLLRRAFRNEGIGAPFTVVASGILAAVVTVYAPGSFVPTLWWGAMVIVATVRLATSAMFRATADAKTARRWRLTYIANIVIAGLTWGIGGAAMLLVSPSPQSHTSILAVIAAISAAAVVYQGAILEAYLGYLLGAQLPIAAALAFAASDRSLNLAILALVYCAAMWTISRRYNHDLRSITSLGYEKQRLSDELANANHKLETDIDSRLRAENLLSAERNLLENVARRMPLNSILDELGLDVEALFPGDKCSVVLLDGKSRIWHASAPSLPAAFVEGVDGTEIGPSVGSCGTAIYLKKQVIVADIANDPLWRDFRDLALTNGLRSCWSTPIISRADEVLGSFAIYRATTHTPSNEQRETINRFSRLIALVVENVRNSERILLSEQRFRDFAGAAADWFWEMDPSLACTFLSEQQREPDKAERDLIIDRTREELRNAAGLEDGQSAEPAVADPETPLMFEFAISGPSRKTIEVMSAAKPVYDEQHVFKGWRGVGRDITRERELEREIRHQATHDSLTGLLNRREFERRLREFLANRSPGTERYVAFIDLDRFKLINDNAGHHAGDTVLQRVAGILRQQLPEGQVIARMGGDEFAACFTTSNAREAVKTMEGVVQALTHSSFDWAKAALHFGASVGLVQITPIYKSTAQVMSDADASCYRAKNRGGNRVILFQPDPALFTSDARSTGELIRALQDSRTLIHVQRIIALQSEESAPWYEALLRYNTGQESASSASRLIPAAERYGQMGLVDTWVLEQCLEHWGTRLADNTLHLSLNLSATSITQNETANEIVKLVEQARLSPGALRFEITETTMVSNLEGAAQFMRDLRGLGCSFVIDNFGGGQSNFSYLKSLPGDYLAIDGGYVRTMTTDIANYAIVDAINKVGRAHGMLALAKYVESQTILEALRDLGVEFAQGHFIGKAIPASEMDLSLSTGYARENKALRT